MDQSKINLFIVQHSAKFSESKLPLIIEQFKQFPDESFPLILAIEFKDPKKYKTKYFWAPGFCFVDRLALGHIFTGLLKLFTFGGLLLWVIVDMFTISSRVKNWNYLKLEKRMLCQ